MVQEYRDQRGRSTWKGGKWELRWFHFRRFFARRVAFGDVAPPQLGRAYTEYHRCCGVCVLIPFNWIVRALHSTYLFARFAPPKQTTRELAEMYEACLKKHGVHL